MATNVARATPTGVHTAGIYADMTVDGPEIGTLVVVVDRAKNLPNRKSMGKQDPYCAARLGKEAKKTETDKRGGQTPRWDQELRFTVHDSPDYYRLKVSVFNDDKKTELIGECWISLDDIVVRGGGQNDLWHNLNCKGRYAGDIRIELTYYDIRPKETKAEDRRQSSQKTGVQDVVREGVRGPRQPKPVKRRPLPANPTEPSPQSMSHSSLPSQDQTPPQRHPIESADQYFSFNPVQNESNDHDLHHPHQELLPDFDVRQPRAPNQTYDGLDQHNMSINTFSTPQYSNSQAFAQGNHGGHPDVMQPQPAMRPSQGYNNGQDEVCSHNISAQEEAIPPAAHSLSQGVQRPQPLRPAKGPNLYHSSSILPTIQQDHMAHLSSNDFDDVTTYGQRQSHDSQQLRAETDRAMECDFNPPPPPPAHRHSASGPSSSNMYQQSHRYSPQTSTNARYSRSSISGSPLAQVQNAQSEQGHDLPASTLEPNGVDSPMTPSPSHAYAPQTRPRGTDPTLGARAQSTLSALVPGYEQRAVAEPPEDLAQDRYSADGDENTAYETPWQEDLLLTQSPGQDPQQYSEFSRVNAFRDTRGHRNSAPVARNSQVCTDPRTPKRKSVSTQPESMASERQRSELPFSPDSFDAFNPNIAYSQSISQAGPQYTTPEQARETAIQHARVSKRGDEPIIGSDGRVIDPSDHLPADTWAPEPEQKGPKRGPEVTLRFRHSPHSNQSLPRAGRAPLAETRPNLVTSPMHTQSAESSPTVGFRACLQKKTRLSMPQHPNSSPIVPTLETSSSSRQPLTRHYASDYPLRERENLPYANSSPTYSNRSPGGMPPPVPSKLPIDRGEEDWTEGNALSEELRSIDIGVGIGHRARVKRYGF